MILKGEQKETKKNKKGLYVLALCGVLAVSGAVYAGTRGKNGVEPEKDLVDLNEDPVRQQEPGNQKEDKQEQPGGQTTDQEPAATQPAKESDGGSKPEGTGQKPVNENEATEQKPVNVGAKEPSGTGGSTGKDNAGKKADSSEKEDADGNEVTAEVMNPTAEELTFSEEEGLCWPLQGDVIKNYSADKMVYFETLQQFRTNPAIFISGEIGADIVAATDGIVKEIRKEDKTGNTLVLDIGEGYLLVYGHLAEITAKEGDYLEAGAVFSKLAPVTKYYQMEGNHLYFQVQKAEETINPMTLIQ